MSAFWILREHQNADRFDRAVGGASIISLVEKALLLDEQLLLDQIPVGATAEALDQEVDEKADLAKARMLWSLSMANGLSAN